jgi:FkbM family methyltransferase
MSTLHKSVSTKYGKLSFTINDEMTQNRVDNYFKDEPEIFDWIESFKENDTIWDIGANIGSYACYMALKGHAVKAFEPISYNYNLLNQNAKLNQLDNLNAFCLAFNDVTKIDYIYMQFDKIGWGCNNFGDETNFNGTRMFKAKNKESLVGYSMDDFIKIFNLEVPNHIKIDVDGIEHKVIQGALNTLKHKNLKSIYIELSSTYDKHMDAKKLLENLGFIIQQRSVVQDHHDKVWGETNNYIFTKGLQN